jgi:rhodanese-related sulfurtransferase
MIFSNWLFRPKNKSDPMEITYEQLVDALRDKTYLVVDVREPLEFEEGHIPGAINVPLSRFDPEALPADKQVVLVCQAGARSAAALKRAVNAGIRDIRHYSPGTLGWCRLGAPLLRGS